MSFIYQKKPVRETQLGYGSHIDPSEQKHFCHIGTVRTVNTYLSFHFISTIVAGETKLTVPDTN